LESKLGASPRVIAQRPWALLTTEFWAMLVVIVAILVATAVSDSLNDTRGWLLVTVVATGYIVSRGIAKAGTGHLPIGAMRRRT
jgi:hypothetical protein